MRKKKNHSLVLKAIAIVALTTMMSGCLLGFGGRGQHIRGGESGADFMKRFDLDGDNKISHDEWEAVKPSTVYREKSWPFYNRDFDSFITQDEVPLAEEGSDAAPEDEKTFKVTTKQIVFIAKYDQNGDLKVSKEEFSGSNFDDYDLNNDGYLEPHEAPKE